MSDDLDTMLTGLSLAQRRKNLNARMEDYIKREAELDKVLDRLDAEDAALEREEKAARKALKKGKPNRDNRKASPGAKRAARTR